MGKKKNYYAVRAGRKTGIFSSWKECDSQVTGFKGAEFKGFETLAEAQNYLNRTKEAKVIRSESSANKEKAISKERVLKVYIDGSYNEKRKTAGYGMVIVKNNQVFLKDFSAYPYEDVIVSHNVGVELIGAKRAVELALANNYKEIIIHYDYMGIEKFAIGEWRAKIKQTKDYQSFMQKYMNLLNIRFVKVKAHSGDIFNEMADKLAKFATNL